LVQFTNLSTGDFDACLWDFGDGFVSSNCGDVSHVYGAAGTYTVTLMVSGPGGIDSEVRVSYITVTETEFYVLYLPVLLRP
jgi:PKD repeat protein